MKTHLSQNWKKDYGTEQAVCGRSNFSKRDMCMNLYIVGLKLFIAELEENRCVKCNAIAQQMLAKSAGQ